MPRLSEYDGVVVGSGPNGLAAAITMAQAGRSVLLLEAEESIGGGTRSAALTAPGFVHDLCSAIHPLGVASPFFRSLPLDKHGLEWVFPPVDCAHPLDDGTSVLLQRSIEATAATLGPDGAAYQRALTPLVSVAEELVPDLLQPLWPPPRHPLLMLRFGLKAISSADAAARRLFAGERARGFFAGLAAHAILPLESFFTATFGFLFALLGHAHGWPFPRGGAGRLGEALAAHLRSLGGEIETGRRVGSLDDLPPSRVVIFDLTPRQVLAIAGPQLPDRYRRALGRYRYGPAAFKLDMALAGPIPWKAEGCSRAATVHLGGTLDEIAESERSPFLGKHAQRPFVIVAQQSLFDPGRAPAGQHTLWAYCHVPHGSTVDMSDRIEAQIERFAPGFRDLVLERRATSPLQLEQRNANCVGGDIAGGTTAFPQLFIRPALRLIPYSTPHPRLYIGSSSTPPGAGVHGMCGFHAARAALRRAF